MVRLDTTYQVIKYIEDQCHFIEAVKITRVEKGMFYFKVQVPAWFKWLFGKLLYRIIEKRLRANLHININFEFEIYSSYLF